MKRSLLTIGLILAILPPAGGQTAEPTTVVSVEIRNVGSGGIDAGLVDAYTRTRAGDDFDRTMASRDVRALLDSGLFTSVDVELEPHDEGVVVVYVLSRKLVLAEPVEFTGSQHLREKKLRELLDLAVGDPVDEHVLGVRTQTIREEFREDYYPYTVITWTIEPVDDGQGLARVRVDIESGPKTRVGAVVFEGNRSIGYHALRRAVSRPAWWNPLWLFRPRRYSEEDLEGLRRSVAEIYLKDGFLDVAVDAPRVTTGDDGRQTVTIPITEGAAYRFDNIAVEGVQHFPLSEVERLVTARSGQVASSDTLRNSVQRVEDFYGTRGYARARVRPQLASDPERGTVDVVFVVAEGDLIRIGNIRIRGNTRTRDKVIRRELLIYPGDELNEVKARRSERRLMNLGFFSDVRRYGIKTAVPSREDVVFDVEEKRTGQFLVGAGFSSVDNIIGFVELSQGNFDLKGWPYFTGGGQKLKLRAQFGEQREDYEISFVEPWFLNRKLALGLDLYRSRINYSDFDLKRLGGAVSISKSLPGANRISFRYSLEDIEITDIADTNEYAYADPPADPYFFINEQDLLKSTLKVTLLHDTRDNPFIPTRGLRASVFGRLSGGPLGFDTDVYGLGGRVTSYWPLWFGHVLSLKGRYETLEAYDDTSEVTISDRLFAGGGRTIRGFGYRDVGPKVVPVDGTATNSIAYRPVGGQSLAVANVEYTVPIVKGIRVAMFYDVGNVWRDPYDFDVDGLASGAGVGLRMDVPGFPIRVDRAWVVHRDDDLTDEDAWVIWIGYDY